MGQCGCRVLLQQFDKERIRKRTYKTREMARAEAFGYIDVFYHLSRRHSHMNGISPEALEHAAA